jgi:cytochrome c oxidase assembly factor CtaG
VDPYRWFWDPDSLVLLPGMAAAYGIALTRFRAPYWRILSFMSGCALMLAVQITPLGTLALHYLLLMHFLQNVSLAEWGPLLVVVGLTRQMASEVERIPGFRAVTHPLVALPVWLGAYYFWHVPWAYDGALHHQWTILHLEHGTYFLTGCLLWWPVVHGRRSSGEKAVYLFAAFVLGSPLGLLLALLPHPVYGFYEHVPRLWGLSALTDQQIAGVTMASEQAIVLFTFVLAHAIRFLREEAAEGVYAPLRAGPPR